MDTPDLAPRILLHHSRLPPPPAAAVAARWLAALPEARRERLLALRRPVDRAASLAGLALLLAAARRAGLAPPRLDALEWPPAGKPRWRGGARLRGAHGGGRVGCALLTVPGRVGLDVEPDEAAAAGELRLVLHPGESAPADRAAATALWVAKESVLKAAGAGITAAAAVRVEADAARYAGTRWMLWRPLLSPGCSCALACDVAAAPEVTEEEADALLAAGP